MTTRGASMARTAYLALAWMLVAAILYQVFLVGLALLAGQSTWSTHVDIGHMIGALPLLLVIVSFFGRLPRSERRLSLLLLGVYIVQAEVFAAIRDVAPLVAALHPVLALVVFTIAVFVALRAGSLVRRPGDAIIQEGQSRQPDPAPPGRRDA